MENMCLEISKILDNHLPANGVGTEREKLRIKLHRDFTELITNQPPIQSEGEMDAEEFIEVNYHHDISKACLCNDKTKEPATYEEVAEAYHKYKSKQSDVVEEEGEPTLTIPDIRNKLSPLTHLLWCVENESRENRRRYSAF